MHIPDGFLSPQTYLPAYAVAAGAWAWAARGLRERLDETTVPRLAMLTALAYGLGLVMVPVPGGTSGHALGVALLALIFGRHLGMEGEVLRRLGFAGLYHDLGKFKVPLDILNKPGKLSDREFAVMQGHCLLGYELLKGQPGVGEDILLGVLHHHERYDGQGYPRKKSRSPVQSAQPGPELLGRVRHWPILDRLWGWVCQKWA